MVIELNIAVASAMLTAIKTAVDNDTNAGKILCYTETMPTQTGGAITTQTLLATCQLSKPCGSVANGVFTFDVVASDLAADASGQIGFVRIIDGANNFILDGNVGTTGSGCFAEFDTVQVIAGGRVDITSVSLTVV
jgi:hypothetical protein